MLVIPRRACPQDRTAQAREIACRCACRRRRTGQHLMDDLQRLADLYPRARIPRSGRCPLRRIRRHLRIARQGRGDRRHYEVREPKPPEDAQAEHDAFTRRAIFSSSLRSSRLCWQSAPESPTRVNFSDSFSSICFPNRSVQRDARRRRASSLHAGTGRLR